MHLEGQMLFLRAFMILALNTFSVLALHCSFCARRCEWVYQDVRELRPVETRMNDQS